MHSKERDWKFLGDSSWTEQVLLIQGFCLKKIIIFTVCLTFPFSLAQMAFPNTSAMYTISSLSNRSLKKKRKKILYSRDDQAPVVISLLDNGDN